MIIETMMTDNAVLAEIGHRIQRRRIEAKLTQEMLASNAGVSKRTVERLESGESVQLTTFIRVMRVLGLLEIFNSLIPEGKPGPLELLQNQGKTRERVKVRDKGGKGPGEWIWGDEK